MGSNDKIIILVIFIIYMLLMVGVGFIFCRKKMSNAQYLLGGRQLNPWVTALSAQASDMSGWLLTGVPGLAYLSTGDAKSAIYTALGLLIGTFFNWVLVAKRLRVYTEVANNSITIPSFFEARFKDKKGVLGVIAGIVILIFFTVYTASMFSAGAKLFETIFGIPYKAAVFAGAAVIVAYTLLGGFLAVSWTDLIQGIIMFLALVFVPIYVICTFNAGQMEVLSSLFGEIGNLIPETFLPDATSASFTGLGIISALGWGLGYFGMPHILVRFMATKDKRTIKPATTIAMIWTTICMACAVIIGVVGRVYLGDALMPNNHETVFMELVRQVFPAVVAGILLSAILAAIMSTADSQLLVASSAFSNDIYKKIFRKNAKDKELVLVSRLTTVVVALIAAVIALDEDSTIFELVAYAWAGFGASFGPLVLFSLYFKNIKLSGAVASIITGAVTTIVFKYGLAQLGGLWAIYEIVPGFILATVALWLGTVLNRKPIDKGILDDFEKFKQELLSDDSTAEPPVLEDEQMESQPNN